MQSTAAAAGTMLFDGTLPEAHSQNEPVQPKKSARPVVISSANGLKAIETAYRMIGEGSDVLSAVIAAVNIVEDDPSDNSVGLGGIPNEDGVVELDASVMNGPTHKAGAVASIRNIRNPSKVARLVMERTDHVLIVGEGALRFARAHGFKEEDLLTEESRKIWLEWKEKMSQDDDWLSPAEAKGEKSAALDKWLRTWGTINCCGVDANGDLAGVTTTSGLGNKIPGRVGDSPIIGAGLYVDNEIGAAGSTGRGEANLQNCSSFLVVELMRQHPDWSPQNACLEVLKRIEKHTEPRLKDSKGRLDYDLKLYALAKDGRYGAATIWHGGKFAVHDEQGARHVEAVSLYPKGEKPEK